MLPPSSTVPPLVVDEDEHLLVVNKSLGWNTHAPGPYAGEGIYDWLRHREPRWSRLAIIHRLDKETSGVMVFGKTPLANRSLTEQFAQRRVGKKYLLLTDRPVKQREFVVKSNIARFGDRYASRKEGEFAETHFRVLDSKLKREKATLVEAEPVTGRTHQIRVHAAERGFPVLGDALYGGSPFARVCLHSTELRLCDPASGQPLTFSAPADFESDPRLSLRSGLVDAQGTNALRLIHAASDGWPGWYVDRLGDFLLSQSEEALTGGQKAELEKLLKTLSTSGVYHKRLIREPGRAENSPKLALGKEAPNRFNVHENGVRFELSFNEGYSVGLFLDQRDNRRRFLTGHVAADFSICRFDGRAGSPLPAAPMSAGAHGVTRPTNSGETAFELQRPDAKFEVLNSFAYTCGFSVCAALAGATTTSLDLSRKYLEWGKRNFALNGLDPTAHEFIFGDVFDWLRRLAKRNRAFDVVILDPPTFSQSKEQSVFRAEKDYAKLVTMALPVIKAGGVLFASTNAARWRPEDFLTALRQAIGAGRRKILQEKYFPQPPDFPVSRSEPAYLKTVWLRIQ